MLSLCTRTSRSTWRKLLRGFLSSPSPASLNSSWSIGNLETFTQHEEKDKSSFQSKSINRSTWYLAAAGFVALNSSMLEYSSCLPLEEAQTESGDLQEEHTKKPRVVFVLGGPGSGKGTQCSRIAKDYGFSHLSAGELLRVEVNSGSQYGTMIQSTIKEGKIVPSEVTVRLLQKAMEKSGNDKFLIDGFPRNEDNRAAFETLTGIQPEFVIFFDCTEEEMERRLLSRNQGRLDDNIDTIRKRFKIFVESSLPVVEYYKKREKLWKIDAVRDVEDVFKSLKPLFKPFVEEDLLRLTKKLLQCIDDGDYEVYRQLCDPALTAFEPESQGHLVEGLAFHKFYFGVERRLFVGSASQSLISAPRITLIGEDAALVTYTRLHQSTNMDGAPVVKAFNETRIWARKLNSQGMLEWKHTHFHRSDCPCY